MGKLTNNYLARLAQIVAGKITSNLSIYSFQFGTSASPAESAGDTGLSASTGASRQVDIATVIGAQGVSSVFYAAGSFGSVTLAEVIASFQDGVCAMRNTTTGLPIANANTVDIRVDVTITHAQV